MSTLATKSSKPPATPARALPALSGVLQRKCACGGSGGGNGKFKDCEERDKELQRKAIGDRPAFVPPIVHEVLKSPGQPLDARTRGIMEPRFGHDFSRVRIHSDNTAAESAEAVRANAYAIADRVVFNRGQYSPNSTAGQKLLAHELAHVVQQSKGGLSPEIDGEPALEDEANRVANDIVWRDSAVTIKRASGTGIARDPQPSEDSPDRGVPSSAIEIEKWPDILPRAVRASNKDASKDENIKVHLGDREDKTDTTVVGEFDQNVEQTRAKGKVIPIKNPYVIHAPTREKDELGFDGVLTAEQQSIVSEINVNREGFRINGLHLNNYQGKYGWQYGGRPGQDATPTQVQGTFDSTTSEGKRKQAQQWIWEELRFEGSSASINAYDSQMVTWGRGLGAATGGLNPTMTALFSDASIANAFLKIGVYFRSNTWLVVNTKTGAVEEGRNALAIIQSDPHILAAMIAIGEGADSKQQVADAQWKGITKHGTSEVPDFALDWDKSVIQLVAHITHWGPAYGWHVAKAAQGYQDSGGDPLKVVLNFMKLAAGRPNKNGAFSIRGNMGPETVANFANWGAGVGLQAIKNNFVEAELTNADIDTNEDYRGKMILKYDNKGKAKGINCYVRDAN